jgi:hypothetical protein
MVGHASVVTSSAANVSAAPDIPGIGCGAPGARGSVPEGVRSAVQFAWRQVPLDGSAQIGDGLKRARRVSRVHY